VRRFGLHHGLTSRARTGLILYALLFVNELVLMGVVPLLPLFEDELGLSKLQVGAFLAVSGVAVLVVAVPAGLLADRFGARRLTIGAGALLALSTLAQALAPDFWTLLAARGMFGAASTTIWTAGLSWLADTAGERRSAALGGTMTMAGLGATVGPVFMGLLGEHFGLVVPLVAVAAAAAAVTVALAALGREDTAVRERRPLAHTFGGIRERLVLGSVLLMALGGLTGSVFSLLGSLQLADNGLPAGTIGLVFSIGAGIFIIGAAVVARLGDRVARVEIGGIATLALGLLLLLLVASTSTAALVTFVVLRAPAIAIVFGISYPLAARGAIRAGVGAGAVMGILNVSWGASTVVGPLAGAAIAEWAGEAAVYAILVVLCLTGAGWMLTASPVVRRVRAAAARAR
jgi:MFS family permease